MSGFLRNFAVILTPYYSKMKKIVKTLAFATLTATLTSCGTSGGSLLNTPNTGSTQTSAGTSSSLGGLLGNVLGTVLGNGTVSQKDLTGKWNYTGSDCVFESENLLLKAGGAVAASKIESEINSKLSAIGIKQGACSFTFNKDNTFTADLGGKKLNGTYTLDEKNKKVTFKTLLGLGTLTANVAKSGNKLSLLFESDKMLKLIKLAGGLTGSTSIKTLTDLAGQYDGMMIGLQLSK